MRRYQLEHALRAACEITGERDFVVIGSSALLGSYPDAPPELTVSLEVDLFPRENPQASDQLNVIGEMSQFHQTHGFWLDPVGPETAIVPIDWELRLIPVHNANTAQATGWCLEVNDLAVSKLFAGRTKDIEFVRALLRHHLIDEQIVQDRIGKVRADQTLKDAALQRLILSRYNSD
jgi:hypothetical protein